MSWFKRNKWTITKSVLLQGVKIEGWPAHVLIEQNQDGIERAKLSYGDGEMQSIHPEYAKALIVKYGGKEV